MDRANIILATLLALSMVASYASGNGQISKGEAPAGMHEETFQGFTFLCPDVMKRIEPNKAGEVEIARYYTFRGTDLANALLCSVDDAEQEFTPEVGRQLVKEMESESPSYKEENQLLKDGLVMTIERIEPGETETIYTTLRLLCKGKKRFWINYSYTESNTDVLAKYADAVINSMKAAD